MKKRIIFFLLTISPLFCLFGLQKQKAPLKTEEYEVKVRLVLVDVIVTKDEKFVADLAKDDFELYEDGKPVAINSLDLIGFGKREIPAPEQKLETLPPSVPRKQLVVVFDGVSSWQRNLKEGSKKIVDELVSLAKIGNEVMVIQLTERRGMEVIQDFTTKEDLIRKSLVRASGNIWFDSSLDSIKMWQEAGLEDVGPIAEAQRYAERLKPSLELEYLYRERGRFEKAIGGVLTVANMIKDLPGRKSILLISDGFPDISGKTLDSLISESEMPGTVSGARTPQLDIRRETASVSIFDPFNILKKKKIMSQEEVIKELIHFANAQNISIYALDPETFTKYLVPASAEYGPRDQVVQSLEFRTKDTLSRVQNLRWLSEDTGGASLMGAKKYDRFAAVMGVDLNNYYQLSYYPPRKEPDNTYHKIDVKVKPSGYDVRFRKGYTDYSQEEEEKILLVSVFYNPSLFKDLPFEGEFAFFHKGANKFEPWMNVALPTKELFLESGVESGLKNFGLHFWVKEREGGKSAFGGQINIPFNIDASFKELIRSTDFLCFHYKGPEIPFGDRDYQAIFALYDDETNKIGAWESSVSLPELKSDKQGGIMSCILGVLTSVPRPAKKSFSLSKQDGSLEYGEMKFFPAVTNQFERLQDTSVFIQAYLPQKISQVSPRFLLLAKGRPAQPLSAEIIAAEWNKKSLVWSGLVTIPMQTVFPGDYTLRVEIPVSDEESKVLTREVKLTKRQY